MDWGGVQCSPRRVRLWNKPFLTLHTPRWSNFAQTSNEGTTVMLTKDLFTLATAHEYLLPRFGPELEKVSQKSAPFGKR